MDTSRSRSYRFYYELGLEHIERLLEIINPNLQDLTSVVNAEDGTTFTPRTVTDLTDLLEKGGESPEIVGMSLRISALNRCSVTIELKNVRLLGSMIDLLVSGEEDESFLLFNKLDAVLLSLKTSYSDFVQGYRKVFKTLAGTAVGVLATLAIGWVAYLPLSQVASTKTAATLALNLGAFAGTLFGLHAGMDRADRLIDSVFPQAVFLFGKGKQRSANAHWKRNAWALAIVTGLLSSVAASLLVAGIASLTDDGEPQDTPVEAGVTPVDSQAGAAPVGSQ